MRGCSEFNCYTYFIELSHLSIIPQTDASHLWGPSCESFNSVVGCWFRRILKTSIFSWVPADIHISDLAISKCCCGSRKSTKSLLGQLVASVPDFKMLLWPPRAQYFDVCNITCTIVTIKLIKQRQGFPSKLDCLLFGLVRPYAFSFKNNSKYTPFWTA